MKVDVRTLPSKGYNYLVDSFELNPLTYTQIINYSKDSISDPLMRVLHDIEYLLGDIQGYKDFSSFDLKALIFTRKYISATFDESIKVKLNNKYRSINISEITYKEISPELMNLGSVKLGGYQFEFSIPTIGKFETVARLISATNKNISPEVAMVVASLGTIDSIDQVTTCILNATGNDIVTIEFLSDILNDTVNDVTVKEEGGEAVVNLNDSITDIFQLIHLNAKFDKTEVFITKTL